MRLIPDWRSAWRWFSVQAFAILAALPLVWPSLPVEVHAWMPEAWRPYAIVLLALGGLAGRLVDQTPKAAP